MLACLYDGRLLRQQLMGGAFTLHEDHEFWTSHATAEITTESKVVAEINSCINSVTLGHTISSDTSQDTEVVYLGVCFADYYNLFCRVCM